MTQTLQPRYALAHVDAAGAHLDDFGGGRDSTQQRHRGGGLQREVVDSEGRVVHADFVRSLGNLQMSLGDLFRRWPALATESVMPEAKGRIRTLSLDTTPFDGVNEKSNFVTRYRGLKLDV